MNYYDISNIKKLQQCWELILPTIYNESLSYIQKLEKILDIIKKLIESNIELTNEWINLKQFIETNIEKITSGMLQEWLDNGTLENMVMRLGQIIRFYDTTEEMIKASNLNSGQVIQTLGYYSKNDGGGSIFYITDKIENGYAINLQNSLFAYAIGEINVKKFGFSNSETRADENTTLLNELVSLYPKIYIPNGDYYISDEIIINKNIEIIMEQETNIHAYNTGKTPTTMFKIGYSKTLPITEDNQPIYFKISGGNLYSNGNYKFGISVNFQRNSLIENTKFYGFQISVYTGYRQYQNVNYGGGLVCNNLYIDSQLTNSYGINDQGGDNKFTNIIIKDCFIGVVSQSSTFINIHTWVGLASLRSKSAFAMLFGNGCTFDNCIIDTLKYGIRISEGASVTKCIISNTTIIQNSSVSSEDIIFLYALGTEKFEDFMVSNVMIKGELNVYFTNSTSSNATFWNNIDNEFYSKPSLRNENYIGLGKTIGNLNTITPAITCNTVDELKKARGIGYFNITDSSVGTGDGIYLNLGNWGNGYALCILMFKTNIIKMASMQSGTWSEFITIS